MNIIISNSNKSPIYEQIKTQIKNSILKGELVEDELLPSIRQLAKDLRISVITTTRAYNDLESEGFVITVPGKGCYVASQNSELIKESQIVEIEDHLSKAISNAQVCGITKQEFFEILNILLEEANYE